MRHLCTLSDNNYLLKGLVLYESLIKNAGDFTLHYLCLDDLAYQKLKSLNLENLVIYNLNDYLTTDNELLTTKNELKYDEFCWSLASYFTMKLLNNLDSVLYCDSDLYFYNDLDTIYDEIGDKSIGLIRHRHTFYGSSVGDFNVGIVYFKNDSIGNESINYWWSLNKTKNHEYYRSHGTCGDQKYLELFLPKYEKELCVIDEKLGHGAPFNFHLYDYSNFTDENKEFIYNGKPQKLIFVHFMKFKPNFDKNNYEATNEPNNQEFMKYQQIKSLYDDYFNETIKTYKKYYI